MSYDIMSFHVMSHFILDYILYHMLYCTWSVIFIYHISYSLSSVSETIYNLQYHKSLTFYCVIFFISLSLFQVISQHVISYPVLPPDVISYHIPYICMFAHCPHMYFRMHACTCGSWDDYMWDNILILFIWLFASGCQRSSRFAGHWSWCNLRKTAGLFLRSLLHGHDC